MDVDQKLPAAAAFPAASAGGTPTRAVLSTISMNQPPSSPGVPKTLFAARASVSALKETTMASFAALTKEGDRFQEIIALQKGIEDDTYDKILRHEEHEKLPKADDGANDIDPDL